MGTLNRWLEITFVLIILYLVLSNGSAFNQIVRSLGGLYVSSVKTLQGR